jgi:hypothetical protein
MLLKHFVPLAAIGLSAIACSDDDDDPTGPPGGETQTFTVRIENVSEAGTLDVTRLEGVVPLSPGVYIVHSGPTNPLFTVGQQADEGTERIAEDGNNGPESQLFGPGSSSRGVFSAPGGADNSPMIGPGEFVTFNITAAPGDRLQIETMFAQSNDWFFTFGAEGLALFESDNDPISGDVTSQIVLYDAGTEEDTPPGTGPDQAPVQAAPNTGPTDDDRNIRLASTSGFSIPSVGAVIRVTITPQ